MARSVEALAPFARPVAFLPESWRIPMMGWFWVLFNIAAVGLGLRLNHSGLCSIVVGGVDGTVLAVIAVARASARFQSAATGLLSGLSLDKVGNGSNLLSRAADSIHSAVDGFLNGFSGATPSPVDSPLHAQIEAAVLRIVWTAIFVILASLIVEWARSCGRKNELEG